VLSAACRRPIERFGDIVAHPILGPLHHRYARIQISEATRVQVRGHIVVVDVLKVTDKTVAFFSDIVESLKGR
jgi:hypothetical protein